MKRSILYSACFILAVCFAKGQDYHLSQYDIAGLYLNPALTGFSRGEGTDYRLCIDQRTQWRALGVKPYLTSYAAFDAPWKKSGKPLGVGGYIVNNNGGIGTYNTLSLMLSAAYDILNSSFNQSDIKNNTNNKHLLTIGLQAGLFYRTTNPNALNYDVQYSLNNGGTFDQSIPSNEIYNRSSLARFDANYGLYYKYIERGKKVYPVAGFSLAHLSRPNESLTSQKSRLPLRWVGHAACDVQINDRIVLTPRILYMNQAKASELMPGLQCSYRLNEHGTQLEGGVDYRVLDAWVINIGARHDKYNLRLSYDINSSYLKNYTKGRGAFEISLVYSGQRKNQAKTTTLH